MKKFYMGLSSFIFLLSFALAKQPDASVADTSAVKPGKATGSSAISKSDTDALAVATEKAINKGIAYLKSVQKEDGSWQEGTGTSALALKAIVHTGLPPGYEDCVDKAVKYLLLRSRYDHTYETALLAMALEDLDRKKYREPLQKCANYLHESQLPHGMWTYTKVSEDKIKEINDVLQARGSDKKNNIDPKRMTALPGDNSNTQFALLGLRAARWAGVSVKTDVIKKAQQHFIRTQNNDGGWGYREFGSPSWGSMTCAALGSLCILDDSFRSGWWFERRKIRKSNTAKGIQWMADNFSVTTNPFDPHGFYYYYMYSMERAGILTRNREFGSHNWYLEGAPVLCKLQQADGSWIGTGSGRNNIVCDTAFAILFLRKGTRFHKQDNPVPDDEHLPGKDETKGNNGLGNGIDPAPPGNPPENDGAGTSPGNPGNKQRGKSL